MAWPAAWRTLEGLELEPSYGDGPLSDAAAGGWPGQAPFVRGSQATLDPLRPWWNCSRLLPGTAAAANRQALEELEGGACGLELPAAEAGWTPADLRAALAGVRVEAIALHLDAEAEPAALTGALLDLARAARADGDGWCLGVDPLRVPAATAVKIAQAAASAAPRARVFLADATPFHEAGAHAVTELALLLAATAESLRALDAAGLAPARALAGFAWRLPMERDFFGGLTKLRAARGLWSRMAAACGAPALPPFVTALTSPRGLCLRDPHGNLLRATVQAAAAIAGGADAIRVQAFDEESPAPTARGRRLARNLQLVLQHEAGLGAVADPAGGSPYVEARTQALAAAAWEEFRGFERAGGLQRALHDGSLRARLDAEWEALRARIAAGEEIVLGVNLHAPETPAADAGARAAAGAGAKPARAPGPFGLPRRREEEAWTGRERPA